MFIDTLIPALVALINGFTILDGITLLNLIPTRVKIPTCTLAANADIHNPTGTKEKKNEIKTIIAPIATRINNGFVGIKIPLSK
ncbi:MAG: hypothetical protein BWY74_04155 [Firmicutes bacterium ADurb.Bin419]|nr:MAG: hypothetical protein BWY74_04155 [Firmicutes bacterium ADurb.Bin419]